MNTTVAVYDTKPYDRESLARVEGAETIDWRFLDFRLGPDSVQAAAGAQAVCVFVSDDAGRPVLEKLAGLGVRLLALRCTGFNNVDLPAAKELGLPVTRVPNYSPYSVAKHTMALILALNRKRHRAFNRIRELNFSLADDVLARLLTFPNVLITAHQAFLTREALNDIARVTVENVHRLAAGRPFVEGTLL